VAELAPPQRQKFLAAVGEAGLQRPEPAPELGLRMDGSVSLTATPLVRDPEPLRAATRPSAAREAGGERRHAVMRITFHYQASSGLRKSVSLTVASLE
jgi:hypothetical protein